MTLSIVAALKNKISDLNFPKPPINVVEDFVLWYHPPFDEDRLRYEELFNLVKSVYMNKEVLEIGYPWKGRHIANSKVMDLYDPRPDIDFRMDACKMNLSNNSFDLVICNSVLEHIPKFWLAIAEIQRVLKPEGIVWISVPSVWPYHPSSVNPEGEFNYGGDYWRMNHEALEVSFDCCEKLVSFYIPSSAKEGDDLKSGWGVVYVGTKIK